MNMGIKVAALEDAIFPQDGLCAEIEWNVKDLIVTFWPDVSQEAEIVFQVFDYVEHQDEIEEGIFLLADVCEFELNLFVCPPSAHIESLWRNFVSPESAFAIQLPLQLFEYLPGTTSGFAERPRLEVVLFQHTDYLFCFPGRLLYVPVGILLQVSTVLVNLCVRHLAAQSFGFKGIFRRARTRDAGRRHRQLEDFLD